MKDLKDKLLTAFYNFAILLPYILAILGFALYIWILIKYGNKPISEVPALFILLLR